jgi:probable HAF family extracellular repeat protein
MRRSLVSVVAVGLVATAFGGFPTPARGAMTASTYIVEDLGTLPGDYASIAQGINRFGDVVGWSAGPTGTRAFLYTNATGMTALAAPAGRPVTTARAISANGTIVGTASTGGSDIGHAVRWRAGTVQDLGTLGTGQYSYARGVNSAGDTVGTSHTGSASHAFLFTDASGMVDLTPTADDSQAEGINDAGQITGWRNWRAFRLTGTTFTDLGTAGFANSFGTAINSSGQVAGHVISGTGNAEQIFRYTSGAMVILGGLGEYNRAYGMNTAGDVVGEGLPVLGLQQGFVYTDANGMQGLNQLIDPASGWFILGAGGINDAGQIAAWASGPNGQRALRLTPGTPAPSVPAAPTNLMGAVGFSTIQMFWEDNSTNELGFRLERAQGTKGSFALLAQIGANHSVYVDASVKAGKLYRYRIQAYNDAGASAWSNTISIRAPRR